MYGKLEDYVDVSEERNVLLTEAQTIHFIIAAATVLVTVVCYL